MRMDAKKETAAGLDGVSQLERSSLMNPAPAGERQRQNGAMQSERDMEAAKGQSSTRKKRNPALRALLWTLRKSIVPILCIAAVLGGMYMGYSIIGKRPGDEVFDIATWKHMYDLVFAD
ncbi:DNA-directed RNA polymerase subunit beta [Paenibacillus sp. CF384]|uniref:DNA-directed RNA polymerase subunit beta n=1 Tax=Paenibacillus sp. CF384 TaxID=1884382 RepID=UPI000897EA36|nr:DNA-directed RNA polymerase subunit beta [Paenibacillus sp. CF384]SDX27693.1 DNA-directed RNA polymerase subunit beta [Paenibacillus sp. CF384]